MENYFI
jgi:hypothetical protein